MNVIKYFVVLVISLAVLCSANESDPDCPQNKLYNETTKTCECKPGFVDFDKSCVDVCLLCAGDVDLLKVQAVCNKTKAYCTEKKEGCAQECTEDGKKVCDTSTYKCVECVETKGCDGKNKECKADNTCGCAENYELNEDGDCVEKEGCAQECTEDGKKVCDTSTHKCVECVGTKGCDGKNKECKADNTCGCAENYELNEDGDCVATSQAVVDPDSDEDAPKPTGDENANVISVPEGDDDASTSTNFMVYFLVAIVLCIVGYVGYHNRKKLMGLVLEGSNGKTRSRARKPNNKDYAKLEENVGDTLSKGSGKTYIY